jgi:hypothetical protein
MDRQAVIGVLASRCPSALEVLRAHKVSDVMEEMEPGVDYMVMEWVNRLAYLESIVENSTQCLAELYRYLNFYHLVVIVYDVFILNVVWRMDLAYAKYRVLNIGVGRRRVTTRVEEGATG